jgi:hypothetical protein
MKVVLITLALVAGFSARAYTTLQDAYAALGFDPAAPGNRVLVHFSDPHLHLDPGDGNCDATNLNVKLVNAINAMQPAPGKILVSGDISSSYSSAPGSPWSGRAAFYGAAEMGWWYSALSALTNVPIEDIRWVPGNHDQIATETNAELFCAMLGRPPHEVLDYAGIRFFLMNGGNCSEPSEPERQWLRQQAAATAPTQTVAVMVHQPAFSSMATERGTGLVLREVFGNWPGRWWLLSGHAHYQELSAWQVGTSEVVMAVSGTVNTNAFCGQMHVAGFRIYCLSNGIAGTIYCHFDDDDFEVEGMPDWAHPIPYVAVFEGIDGLLWRRLKSPALAPEVVYAQTYGSLYWYAYPVELQWQLPLNTFSNQATHFLIASGGLHGRVSFSFDRTNWVDVPDVAPTNQVYAFPLPAGVAVAATGYARFWHPTADNFIGGWGLATTNSGPHRTYPWLAPVGPQVSAPGRRVAVQLVAEDPFAPPDLLKFKLLSGPPGACLDEDTGAFTWTPAEVDVGQSYLVQVKVCDQEAPEMSATNRFLVAVEGTNRALALPGQTDRTVAELTTLTVTNTALATDIPSAALTYDLIDPPAGAAIETNGVITWTPSETQGPGAYWIVSVVKDGGIPPLSATNSFAVVVQEINTPPVLPVLSDRTVFGTATLVVTNGATDPDTPANTLSYGLAAAPPNAVIDTNGVIFWTPLASDVPGTYVFTAVVTDHNPWAVNAQELTDSNSFTVVVKALSDQPNLAPQADRTIAELTALVVTNQATVNGLPAAGLTYALVDPPARAAIDANGVITWTPDETQGPGTNVLITVVSNDGAPPLTATNSFQVSVQEINTPPQLPAQSNRTVVGRARLVVTNAATDLDLPANSLRYVLAAGPTNAVIDAAGIITWAPLVSQVPGTNEFKIVATDNNPWAANEQQLSATNTFTVVVQAVHNPPVLPTQTDATVREPVTLAVTNTATADDVPPLPLIYELRIAPAGARITTEGVIYWTPSALQAPSTNLFLTVVKDSSDDAGLSATNAFLVVLESGTVLPGPAFRAIACAGGATTLTWSSLPGRTYRLQYTEDLTSANWTDLWPDTVAAGTNASATNETGASTQRFYRVILRP